MSGPDVAGSPSTRTVWAAARLEALAPGYLERVRRASLRLGRRDAGAADLVTVLADVEDTAPVDVEVPIVSRRRSVRLVKVAVKKLVVWYLRYLTQQVTAFNAAVGRFGAVLVERTEQLEESTTALAADHRRLATDLQSLARRVERLERGGGGGGDGEPPA